MAFSTSASICHTVRVLANSIQPASSCGWATRADSSPMLHEMLPQAPPKVPPKDIARRRSAGASSLRARQRAAYTARVQP